MRVLVIDSDATVLASIELMLKAEGFNVYSTNEGEEGAELAKLYDYDVVVLDLTLPDISGFDVLRQIRRAGLKTPVMILSGMSAIEDKVKAIGLGADDYMTKPFHKDELVARLNGLVRRSKGHAQSVIVTRGLSLNLDTKRATIDGTDVHLTGKEYQMLELLSLRKGLTLTKEAILNHLYGGMDEPDLKIVDVFVCKLRKKMRAATGTEECFVETVWGRGYLIRDAAAAPVSMSSEVAGLSEDPPAGYFSKAFKGAYSGVR